MGARRGDPVTLAEFGREVAEKERRDKPYTAATVSGWEQGTNEPTVSILKAITLVAEMSKDEAHDFILGETEAPRLRETPIKRVSSADEKRKRKGA